MVVYIYFFFGLPKESKTNFKSCIDREQVLATLLP